MNGTGQFFLAAKRAKPRVGYITPLGVAVLGHAEDVLSSQGLRRLQGRVQLILTSPPFPLNRHKAYGNLEGSQYMDWLTAFAPIFRRLLTPNGSLVVELGNAWLPGRPVMSTLALESLLALMRAGEFHLCQQFVYHNPARLPTPAQWVSIERIRVKDAYTLIWWMSISDRPKADNRRVLRPYSPSMRRLLSSGKYNCGLRPSEHRIGRASFCRDNGGAIPSNVLVVANTGSNDPYQKYCRTHGLPCHPARMPTRIAEFFVKFLTDEGDLVLDPFAGSNTTGAAAESLGRRWVSIEPNPDYLRGSRGRFTAIVRDFLDAPEGRSGGGTSRLDSATG